MFTDMQNSLRELCVAIARPWLLGFRSGSDSTMAALLVFDPVLAVSAVRRIKPIAVPCTDTSVRIPSVGQMGNL
jgi:hypothetical protein